MNLSCMEKSSGSNIKSILAGILSVFIWSVIPALVKVGSHSDTLTFFLVGRFVIASILFLPFLKSILLKGTQISLKNWILLTLILAGNFYFQGQAMETVPTSWYLVVFSLNPVLALLFIGAKWSRNLVVGLSISIIGSLFFINSSDFKIANDWMALMYMLLGMLTWVAYTFMIKRFQGIFTDSEATGVTQFLALIGVSAIWLAKGMPAPILPPIEMISIGLLGVVTPLAYFLFSYSLRRTPRFGIVSQYLEPLFGAMVGVAFLNESLTIASLLGAVAIIAGAVKVEQG